MTIDQKLKEVAAIYEGALSLDTQDGSALAKTDCRLSSLIKEADDAATKEVPQKFRATRHQYDNQAKDVPNAAASPSGLLTEELAYKLKVQPGTLRSRFCKTGSYFGVVPIKLPNGKLWWPPNSLQILLGNGGAS